MRKNVAKCWLVFVLGISVGMLMSTLFSQLKNADFVRKYYSKKCLDDNLHSPAIKNNLEILYKDKKVALDLAKKVRMLCLVLTHPNNLYTQADAVRSTWARRCNVVLFVSSVEDSCFPAVGVNVAEGRNNLWAKTAAAWRYVFKHHLEDADWFVKADDDTYLIVENLRYFLTAYNTTDPHFFGSHMQQAALLEFHPNKGYNSGGAGYVFSKETLKRFERTVKDPEKCQGVSTAEDVRVAQCLREAGVESEETRDDDLHDRFHPFNPIVHAMPGYIEPDNWIYRFNKWEVKVGKECCSKYSVSFHYTPPNYIYLIDFMLYHVRPYALN